MTFNVKSGYEYKSKIMTYIKGIVNMGYMINVISIVFFPKWMSKPVFSGCSRLAPGSLPLAYLTKILPNEKYDFFEHQSACYIWSVINQCEFSRKMILTIEYRDYGRISLHQHEYPQGWVIIVKARMGHPTFLNILYKLACMFYQNFVICGS